jgi:small subunit ribosomal protein S6
MTKYELTLLLEKEDDVKTIKTLIQSLEGKISQENKWGKKNLAYPIKKQTNAYFFHWILEMPIKNVTEMRKKLNFNEQILRYLLLKID